MKKVIALIVVGITAFGLSSAAAEDGLTKTDIGTMCPAEEVVYQETSPGSDKWTTSCLHDTGVIEWVKLIGPIPVPYGVVFTDVPEPVYVPPARPVDTSSGSVTAIYLHPDGTATVVRGGPLRQLPPTTTTTQPPAPVCSDGMVHKIRDRQVVCGYQYQAHYDQCIAGRYPTSRITPRGWLFNGGGINSEGKVECPNIKTGIREVNESATATWMALSRAYCEQLRQRKEDNPDANIRDDIYEYCTGEFEKGYKVPY